MVAPSGAAILPRMEIVCVKIKRLKGTVPHHLRVNTAVRRIVNVLIKQAVQGFADIKHRLVLMDGQGVRCNLPRHDRKGKLLFHASVGWQGNFLLQAELCRQCHDRRFLHLPDLPVPVKKLRPVRLPLHAYPVAKQTCRQLDILRDHLLADCQISLRRRD